jgi:hypothetical protein
MEYAAFAVALAALAAAAGLRRENLRLRKELTEPKAQEDAFAPGVFTDLGDSDKLSTPAFERHESGVVLRGAQAGIFYTDGEGMPAQRAAATHCLIREYDENGNQVHEAWARLLGELRPGE